MIATAKHRIPLRHAEAMALDLAELLMPGCEEIHIAGSIRRRRELVADVELVIQPRITVARIDLFGNTAETVNEFDALCYDLNDYEVLQDRLDKNGLPAWGTRYKRALYQGFPVDLFSVVPPAQFGVVMAIRTGSAEFSKRIVTQRRKGGSLPDEMFVDAGQLFLKRWGSEPKLIPTPTEERFFEAIGMPYIRPEERT